MKTRKLILQILSLLILPLIPISGQEDVNIGESTREEAVNVFIDCQRCDMNYIRDEITYVNYVRDFREADVYILETRQSTGSGGSAYTYLFVGQNDFKGWSDTLLYSTVPDETYDQTREGRTHMLRLGLMPYVAKTPLSKEIVIEHKSGSKKQEVKDNWNFWVFEIETRPRLELEETLREVSVRNSLSATKISEDWKVEIDFDHSFNRTKYIEEDTTYSWIRKSLGWDNLIVKSLNDHWSAGIQLDIASSTFSNTKLGIDIFPSVEYNIFPYSESTTRQLRILYGAGYTLNSYNDTTIYNKMEDRLFQHKLEIAFRVQQKWGSANLSLETSNYLNDWSKNRIELEGSLRIRILKGLSFQVNGGIARIRDQLSLTKGEKSTADILLKLQELQTAYTLEGSIGFTYTFGSIYNNIVNPRFGNGGGYNRR